MKNIRDKFLISLIALSVGGASQAAIAAASTPNPIVICIYTSKNVDPKITTVPIVINPITTKFNAWTTASSKRTWSPNPELKIKIPAPGTRVCSAQLSGSSGWTDDNFGLTDPITYSGGLLGSTGHITMCTAKNLVTNRSQIGNGVEYAIHYSITKMTIAGVGGATTTSITNCAISNVDLDS